LIGVGTPLAADDPAEPGSPSAGGDAVPRSAKASKPPDPEPDLTAAERAVLDRIGADETLRPIVRHPERLARDLVAIGPGVDVAAEVVLAGAWLRSNPANAKRNGARFLTGWVQRSQEHARSPPRAQNGAAQPRRSGSLRCATEAEHIASALRDGTRIVRMPD